MELRQYEKTALNTMINYLYSHKKLAVLIDQNFRDFERFVDIDIIKLYNNKHILASHNIKVYDNINKYIYNNDNFDMLAVVVLKSRQHIFDITFEDGTIQDNLTATFDNNNKCKILYITAPVNYYNSYRCSIYNYLEQEIYLRKRPLLIINK